MRRTTPPILALALAALLALPAAVRPAPAAALSCGPCPAVAAEQVNLRDAPSLDSTVLRLIPAGAELQWVADPPPVAGYVPVIYEGITGWAHDDYLLLYPASATTLAAVNRREAPGLASPVVGVVPAGASLLLLNGPRHADGRAWYQVFDQSALGGTPGGWVAGDYLDLDLR